MRVIATTVLCLCLSTGAMAADGFGPRFSGNPPVAFLDNDIAELLNNIQPAAGGEDFSAENKNQNTTNVKKTGIYSLGNGLIRVYPEPLKK